MANEKVWECPECKTNMRETGVRVIQVGASYWDEWRGTGETGWYADERNHGDGENIEVECLKCQCELLGELASEIHDDILANWC